MERDDIYYQGQCYPNYFNSHAHVERDQGRKYLQSLDYNFNSHAHVERDLKKWLENAVSRNFNSHAHVERDASFFRSKAFGW